MKHLKEKYSMFVALATSLAISANTVLAETTDNPFDTIGDGVQKGQENISNLGFIIAIAMLVVSGIALMSTQKMREWAKSHIGYIIVGVIIIVVAGQLVAYIKNIFG